MTFNISKFSSKLNQLGGIGRTDLFKVEIAIPPAIKGKGPIDSESLTFLASAVNIPGVHFTTTDVQRYGYGPIEKVPTAFDFDQLTINFIGDGNANVQKFFRNWTRAVVEYQSVQGAVNPSRPSARPYFVGYKDDYSTQINITQYSSTGQPVDTISCIGCWPLNVMDVYLNWQFTDQLMLVPVQWHFIDQAFGQPLPTTNGSIPQSNPVNFLEAGYKGLTGIQQLIPAISSFVNNSSSLLNGIRNLF